MFDEVVDAATFHAAVRRVRDEPYGVARSAAAEAVLAAAERLGDTALVAHGLVETIVAYNYGGESPKSTVSMGRLLRLFDTRPDAFDQALTHYVFWYLKWVTSSLLDVPEIPLTTIRRFLDDMERRYRAAGHSLRPVHQCRFYLYDHTGDEAAAAREFEAWLAAERDDLADCDACERREQGRRLVLGNEDARALEIFEPTLSGARSCAEEPQITLSDSLVPLVRVGRLDDARGNHLRGYRMARGNAGMHDIIGRHIEFCALTGNEGRGIEILAAHRSWLTAPTGSTMDRLEFLGGVAVLLRRLVALGRAGMPVVPVPGTDGTASGLLALLEGELADIARRFDERNGSASVGTRLRERLDREPLVDSLPLGVRSVLAAAPAGPRPAVTAPKAGRPGASAAVPLDELVEDARKLDAVGHPRAHRVWEQYADAAESRGVEPSDRVAAEMAAAQGLARLRHGDVDAAIAQFAFAAESFERAGLPGKAEVARARTVVACLHSPEASAPGRDTAGKDAARNLAAILDAATERVTELVASGSATDEDLGVVLAARMTAARIRLLQADDEAAAGEARAAAETEADRLAATADRLDLAPRQAEVAEARAHFALLDGDRDTAQRYLMTAVDRSQSAGRPWQAVQPARILGNLLLHQGNPSAAEAMFLKVHDAARDSLETSEEYAEILIGLANATAASRPDAARAYAVRAAHEYDRLGDRVGAAYCRQALAVLLQSSGLHADAVAVLEETMPDIAEYLGEEAAWHARRNLAAGLSAVGETAEAADVLAALARDTAGAEDAEMHAEIAADAAHALSVAGHPDAADRAFRAAAAAMRPLDRPGTVHRLLRAAAWNLIESRHLASDPEAERTAVDTGLGYFAEASAVLDAATADGPDLDRALERANTEAEWTEALWITGHHGEALALADRASARLEITLPRFQDRYTAIVTIAARIEYNHLDMPALAVARLDAALLVCRTTRAETAAAKLGRVRDQLTN